MLERGLDRPSKGSLADGKWRPSPLAADRLDGDEGDKWKLLNCTKRSAMGFHKYSELAQHLQLLIP